MALSIDGTPAHGISTGTSTVTATITTTLTNDIIIADIYSETVTGIGFPAIPTVTGGGLSWNSRNVFNAGQTGASNSYGLLARWWALASTALTSQVITATFDRNTDDCCMMVYAVNGANTTTPFDVNVNATKQVFQAGAGQNPTITGISTTAANTMLLMASGNDRVSSYVVGAMGGGTGTFIAGSPVQNGAGANAASLAIEQLIVSAAQSSISTAFVVGITGPISIFDAVAAASIITVPKRPTRNLYFR